MTPPPDRTMAAAGAILLYAVIIGVLDNYVRVVAAEAGLWQFHATRSAMAVLLLIVLTRAFGMRLWPVNFRAVAARSAIHGIAMLIYFGALGFLPVAQVAAGLFTAPIFVLLISRFVYGQPIGRVQAMAVVAGFAGVVMVLGPEAARGASLASLLPVAAGALYAMGNIATRAWCPDESAATLLFGFFAALGVFGVAGLAFLGLFPVTAPDSASGFVLRGYVTPSLTFWVVVAAQAAGSMLAVGLMIRAYQIANAGRVSVFEYVLLPTSAFWGWLLWSEVPTLMALTGMALIAGAGAVIVLAAADQPAKPSATAARQ